MLRIPQGKQDLQDYRDYFLRHFPDENDETQSASGGKQLLPLNSPQEIILILTKPGFKAAEMTIFF